MEGDTKVVVEGEGLAINGVVVDWFKAEMEAEVFAHLLSGSAILEELRGMALRDEVYKKVKEGESDDGGSALQGAAGGVWDKG